MHKELRWIGGFQEHAPYRSTSKKRNSELNGLISKARYSPSAREFQEMGSPDSHERWIDGYEIDAILRKFQLRAIVRDESEGKYYAPDLHPNSHQ